MKLSVKLFSGKKKIPMAIGAMGIERNQLDTTS
jgi:hypothetical protein